MHFLHKTQIPQIKLKGTGMGWFVLYVWIVMAFLYDHSINELSLQKEI